MSTETWTWIGTAVISFPILLAIGLAYYRAKKPHSKKKAEEQNRLDQKTGAASGTYAAPAAGSPAATKTKTEEDGESYGLTWLKSNATTAITVLLLIGGAVAIYWSTKASVRPADMGSWGWKYLPQLLIFWIMVSAIVALNVRTLGAAAKVLQTMLAVAMFMVLIGMPVVNLIWGEKQPDEKLALSMPANGDSSRISAPAGYATAFTGSGFTTHCVYTDGSEGIVGDLARPCKDGPMLYQYVRDTTGKQNRVTYTFVRPK